MQVKVFAIYDMDSEAYNQPFQMLTFAEAKRAVSALAFEQGHMFNTFPHRFELFQLATFDNVDGIYKAEKKSMGTIAALKVDQHNVETLFPSEEKQA